MSSSGDVRSIVDSTLAILGPMMDAVGYYHLAGIVLSVVVLLGSLYLRPIRTKSHLAVVLFVVFAVVAVCSMTLWFLLKAALT